MNNDLPTDVSKLTALFKTLEAPRKIPIDQGFIGCSAGPWWLRAIGWPLLNIGAMAGWKGKHFKNENLVLNLVDRNNSEQEVMPISASLSPFTRGKGEVLLLSYPESAPFPWNFIIDELRCLPNGQLLGLTTLNLPLLRTIPFPFTLTPRD